MRHILFSRLSIRQRLPLLICSLLLSVILVFGILSYLGVRKAALKAGQERLYNQSQQLSNMLSTSAQHLITSTYAQANKPAVTTYLQSDGKDSASAINILFNEILKDSSNVQVQLLNAEKKLLLNSAKPAITASEINELLPPITDKPDTGEVGNIYAIGNFFCYPIIVPVVHEQNTIGFLMKWRKLQAGSGTLVQLSQLLGTNAKLYLGNADGSLWTDMIKPVPAPPSQNKTKKLFFQYDSSGEEVLAFSNPIANSQWLVLVEFSKAKILQTANNFLY